VCFNYREWGFIRTPFLFYVWFLSKGKLYLGKLKHKCMYSLKCSYYQKEFKTLNELVSDVIKSGMDPNYEITFNGKGIKEEVINYISF
jgi:hypothetical protein